MKVLLTIGLTWLGLGCVALAVYEYWALHCCYRVTVSRAVHETMVTHPGVALVTLLLVGLFIGHVWSLK
jgi:hypothetical protein